MRANTSRWSSELSSSVLMLISSCCMSSWPSSLADVVSSSSYCRALRMAMAARLAKRRAGSSSRSSKVRPPSRSMVMMPMTSSPTDSGTRMHACCSSHSVPGMYTARGSVGHVVDELGLVVAHHPAADALVDGDGEVEDLLLVLLVARVDGDELPALGVDQAHVHGVVVDDLLERVGDVLQHLGLLERREHGAAGAEQLVAERQLLLELLRRLLGLLVLARVVDGDGGEVGEQRDRLQLALVEGALSQPVEREHAEHRVAQRERRDDARLRLPLRAGHERAARVVQHVVDELRLVVAHDPAADADVDGAAPGAHLLLVRPRPRRSRCRARRPPRRRGGPPARRSRRSP